MSQQTLPTDAAAGATTASLSCDGLHQVDVQAAGLLRDLVMQRLDNLGRHLLAGGDPGRADCRNLYALAAIHQSACEQLRSKRQDEEQIRIHHTLTCALERLSLYRQRQGDFLGELAFVSDLLRQAVELLSVGP